MVKIKDFEFTIGADPEVFVMDSSGPVSAYGMIPGTKADPFKVKNGAVQVDGMALEFNINPAKNEKEFNTNIDSVLTILREMTPGYELMFEPVAHFGEDYIRSQPKEARELGCDPDYNAYTGLANPSPNVNAPFRTASGHIHIGWTKPKDDKWPTEYDVTDPGHFEACCMLAKTLDLYLGVPSIVWDKDVTRQELYGKPGTFRPKPYGMEYRVLSNKWLEKPHLRSLVYNNTIDAIKALFENSEVF